MSSREQWRNMRHYDIWACYRALFLLVAGPERHTSGTLRHLEFHYDDG